MHALFYLLVWFPLVAYTVLSMNAALDADRNRHAAWCAAVLFMFILFAGLDLAMTYLTRKDGGK